MLNVHERIYVGDINCCSDAVTERAYVHACKSPCHQRAVGYTGSLLGSHKHYLTFRRNDHLYLNLIDPPVPLFTQDSFREFRIFAAEQWNAGRELVIHCNQGESRAPSLALLFLSKDLGIIPSETYEAARAAFAARYPRYNPGLGIVTFLKKAWRSL
ncbi:hypothetical protein [Sorangium sp. So ce362]|uniref:hypothetical protein n=1 Tax=Sorangium sp. So ce362 TaxID=3133303 RepID=UPI003F61E26D